MADDKSWLDAYPIIRTAPSTEAAVSEPEPAGPAAPARDWVPDPSAATTPDPVVDALGRVGTAVAEGWRAVPPILTPEAQAAAERGGPLGKYGTVPLLKMVEGAVSGGNALLQGARQGLQEVTTAAGAPGLDRDLNALLDVLPFAHTRIVRPNMTPLPRSPKYVSERMTPARMEGQTDLDRMTQLIRHDDQETRPPEAQPPEARVPDATITVPPRATGADGAGGIPQRPKPDAVTADPSPDLKTSAGAKRVANYYYQKADEVGGTLTPQFTDRFIDSVNKKLPQTEMGRAVAGESEAAALAKRLQDQRGQPMTLQALQEADEGITGLITKEWGVTGISKDGLKLQEVQRGLRDQIMRAEAGDIEGGVAGFEALQKGRQAWSAAMLLRDLEAIRDRASRAEQPSTSIRTQVRTLLGNASKSRWYSPEEVAALEDAAQRGVLGGAFHVAGNRLVPMLAGTIGFSTSGPIGAMLQGGAAGVVSAGARNIATRLQERRLGRVSDIVSRRVPTPPRNAILEP